ncbi:MAG: putative ABC transporter periplasmic-binding protein [Euryarchaeota archaeon ADurb.Bin294]|nr:MAG: putative ABC transporter periplasmic-binding protein [Euryarchaeota archaeon ADurb.Bin294]
MRKSQHKMCTLLFLILSIVSVCCSMGVMADDAILRIATTNEVKSPAFIGDYTLGLFNHLSNPPLMQMDENGKLIGLLADHYEVSPDNTEWTFVIKDNQFWSDGTPVTADDVAFSIQMYGTSIPNAGWIGETLTDTQVDGNKVTFKFNKPYTNLALEFTSYSILPKHIWESIENPNEFTSTGPYVGAGPYYLDNVDLNAGKVIFKRNPSWKGKISDYDTVEISWFKNEDAAAKALESGVMDTYWKYASSYPYAAIDSLTKTGNFEMLEKPTSGLTFLGFNLKREPMSDPAFREAVSSAINYQELVDISTLGYGKVPNRGFVPPAMDGYIQTKPMEYNLETARNTLESAGYKDSDGNGIIEAADGKDITLDLLIRNSYAREAELMKEYLEKAGIGVEVRSVEDNTWFEMKDKLDYDITLTRTTPWGMLMHAGWATGYFDSRRTGQGVLHTVDDEVFLKLCDDILSTTDQTLLKEYAKEVQEYYAENLPGIPLYWKNDITPYNKKITGWYSNPLYGIMNEFTFTGVKSSA